VADTIDQAAQWDRWADEDVLTYGVKNPAGAADFLRMCAPTNGRALELGPGVGLVARELAVRGIEVVGLDISPQMVERLTRTCRNLPVTGVVGNMAEINVPGPFDLVYATNSTIYSLLTQEEQLACFTNVAKILNAGGRFVVEAFAPLRQGAVKLRQNLALRALVGDDVVDLSATDHDPATQRLTFREIRIGNDGSKVLPVDIRYIWPSEMNLLAQLAGMHVADRFSGYDGSPYTSDSVRHVSVYRRP